jgi:hypothetical protein
MQAIIDAANLTIRFRPDPAEPIGGALTLCQSRAERFARALQEHANADCYEVRADGARVEVDIWEEADTDDAPGQLAIEAFADVVIAQLGASKLTEALNSDGMRAVVGC